MPTSTWVMDQRHHHHPHHLSQFPVPSDAASSFFSDELRFPAEKRVGFWKPESMPDHSDGFSLMSGSKSVSSSPYERLQPIGTKPVERLDLLQPYRMKDQRAVFANERQLMDQGRATNLPQSSWRAANHDVGSISDGSSRATSLFSEGTKATINVSFYDNGLFSSSLSDIFDQKLRLAPTNDIVGTSVDKVDPNSAEDEPFESTEDLEALVGNLLPDDDELLSGVFDNAGYAGHVSNGDDVDDDIFFTGGGMELEVDDVINGARITGGGASSGLQGMSNGQFNGEHPYGEHPSRTLFVRNINSNVEDSELKVLFEQYGDIRALYTACKHRGFVMISYYDIRSARNAMRALQNKPLRRRKLDIHYSIPKDNPSEKDINQGTLMVFNLDPSVSNDDLHQKFGIYGEIKEIRETPHKSHHKFIEFFDVRAAEAALRALNKSDIAGKKIKLEPSRPGGARRLMQQSPELEPEEQNGYQLGSPNSPPSGCIGSINYGSIMSNGVENGNGQGHSGSQFSVSPFRESAFPNHASSIPRSLPSPVGIASAGSHSNQSVLGELSHSLGKANFGLQGRGSFHPHSLPEYQNGASMQYNLNALSAVGTNGNSRVAEAMDNRHAHKVGSGNLNGHTFDHNEGAFGFSRSGSCPLHGHQNMWNNANSAHHQRPSASMMWPNSGSFGNNVPSRPPNQMHGIPRAPSHMLDNIPPMPRHHIGSAPSVNPSLWERRHNYGMDLPEVSGFHHGSLGSMGFPGSPQLHQLELNTIFAKNGGNCIDPAVSPGHMGVPSPQQMGHMFHGRNPMVPLPSSFDPPSDRMRSRRNESSANQAENRRQYELDLERIMRGEDSRTTLMIKNIPNKYTSKMLLAAIDENHRGTYDFIYLPIDFKNKCNVGYAFINMINPQHIVPFYQTFNGKKWEKFNSEKVASLAYARIQGKTALVAHFQNSSLMNEDKRCRPILFHSEGPNVGDQEPFPMGFNIRSRSGRSRSVSSEENNQDAPLTPASGETSSTGADSSSGSTKDSE